MWSMLRRRAVSSTTLRSYPGAPQLRARARLQPTPYRASRGLATAPTEPSPSEKTISRVDRIISRLPKSFRPYTTTLLSRPASTITSFLILHELTAVIPLFGFFYLFHASGWTPVDLLPEEWVEGGVERFEKYVEKKGWGSKDGDGEGAGGGGSRGKIVVELATSYAVVKALLPARIILSVWAAPWFARVFIVPITKIFRRGKPTSGSGAV
ncbi:hypothetical protein ABW19_dt0205511 [Dactylella cylindrospora]|nr:hypothetical protein ABW19_dt0205511 [Dactylella cylindrospora]